MKETKEKWYKWSTKEMSSDLWNEHSLTFANIQKQSQISQTFVKVREH